MEVRGDWSNSPCVLLLYLREWYIGTINDMKRVRESHTDEEQPSPQLAKEAQEQLEQLDEDEGHQPPVPSAPYPECAICCADMVLGAHGVPVCPAGHCFHSDCIQRWADQSLTCPTCRAPLLDTVLSPQQMEDRFDMEINQAVVADDTLRVQNLLHKSHPRFGCSLMHQVRQDESGSDELNKARHAIAQIVVYAVRRNAKKVLSMLETVTFDAFCTGAYERLSLFHLLLPGPLRVNLPVIIESNFKQTSRHWNPAVAARISIGTLHSVLLAFDAKGGLLNTRTCVRNVFRMLLSTSYVEGTFDTLTSARQLERDEQVLHLADWLGKRTMTRIDAVGDVWKRDTDRYPTVLENILHEVFSTLLTSEFGELISFEPEIDEAAFDAIQFMTHFAERADPAIRDHQVISGTAHVAGSISPEAGHVVKAFLVGATTAMPLESALVFRSLIRHILQGVVKRMERVEPYWEMLQPEQDNNVNAAARLRRVTTCSRLKGMMLALEPTAQERRIARMLD